MDAAYRPLTLQEHAVLIWMLQHGPAGASNFIPQLDSITARHYCRCGCPSIEFNVPLEAPFIREPMGMRAFYTGRSAEYDVGLMLTAGNGALTDLEVYVFGENEHPFPLPTLESLKVAYLARSEDNAQEIH